MVPVVALGVSTLFENFVWEPHIFAGIALILFGNIVILARKPKGKGEPTEKSMAPSSLRKAA
jgi:drug/metabolite transporter (DMT)-like permease